jgi:hypothetical protein
MSETEPSPGGVLAPQEPYRDEEADASADFARLTAWLASHWIPLLGVLMVAAQTWWMSALLAHSFFWIEDFYMVQRAATNGLTWNYLMWLEGGHMMPVGYFITWLLTRASLYNWTPFVLATLALSAVAGLMLLRLLRTLFGDRPGILLLLAISLLSPLAFPGLSWWAVSSTQLPFQIALFGAVTSHVRYVRTGARRSLAATVGWVALGMAGSDKGLAIPVLLFAITSAFMMPGTWRHGAWSALRRYWREWILLVLVMAVYVAIYLIQLHTSSSGVESYRVLGGVLSFIWTLITVSLIPGMLGGPWRWWGGTGYSMAGTPQDLEWISIALVLVVFVITLTARRGAWRSWAILLCWVCVVDILPTMLGRGALFTGAFLGHETRYLMEVPGIVAILGGLVFLPTLRTAQSRQSASRTVRVSVLAVTGMASLLTAVLIGSVWSFHSYITSTKPSNARSYLATARLALAQAPAGTVIVNSPVPLTGPMAVLGGLLPGGLSSDMTAAVLSPMLAGKNEPRFVDHPDGTLDHLMEFDAFGRLVPAAIYGPGNAPIRSCWMTSAAPMNIQMTARPSPNAEMRIGYIASAPSQMAVTYAGQTSVLSLGKGLHTAFIPVQGSGQTVSVTVLTPGILACVGNVEIGFPLPSSGPAIPAIAASG